MTLNLIDKNMIVQTSVELHPKINYVSASNDCQYLDRLEIESPGIFGNISSKTNNIKENTLFNINDKFFNNTELNTLERIEEIKNFESQMTTRINDNFAQLDTTNFDIADYARLGVLVNVLTKSSVNKKFNDEGIQRANNEYFFNIEKIKNSFLLDGHDFYKKKSVKNLYSYYRENIKHNNFHDLNWGFKNYNTINFFNLHNLNDVFNDDITHKNCIIYPNLLTSNKNVYNVFENNESTFSFYINPKRKNYKSNLLNKTFHYNPGCILNIPGVISIYIIKGSSLDLEGLTNKFRIFIEVGNSTYDSFSQNILGFNLENDLSQTINSRYLSEDNILSYNNWHNVCIACKANDTELNNKLDFSLFVDKVNIENFQLNAQMQLRNGNSFLSIGNNPKIAENDISDFVIRCFSKDNVQLNDNEGPYVNKHILYGSDVNSVLSGVSNPNNSYEFKNSLNSDDEAYIDENTSLALNAEICDIRIYNQFLSKSKIENIFDFSVESIQNEINDFNLLFYLPVYYRSQNVKRKGLVNLSAPYQKISETEFTDFSIVTGNSIIPGPVVPVFGTVGEYLNGIYYDSNNQEIDESVVSRESDFKIKTQNIAYNFPINPLFFNFTGGTEVSTSHFLREFVKQSQPNTVIGNSIKEDRYQDCFLAKTSYVLENKLFNEIAKTGGTPNDLFEFIIKNINQTDVDSLSIDYQNNNILYNNKLILSNDNGLQRQFYNDFNYTENDDLNIHKNETNLIDYSFVSLENDNQIYLKENSIKVNNPSLLMNEYIDNINNSVVQEEERTKYVFEDSALAFVGAVAFTIRDSEGTSLLPFFDEDCSKIKNISLANFHDQNKNLYINEAARGTLIPLKINKFRKTFEGVEDFIEMHTRSSFFKTLSNPSQRSYYSLYDNAISNVVYENKIISDVDDITYKKLYQPLYQVEKNIKENFVSIFAISTQLFNSGLLRQRFNVKDVNIENTGLQLEYADTILGTLYRKGSLTKPAYWNTSGNILYDEGIFVLTHPSCFEFGKNNIKVNAESMTNINVFELNVPSIAGQTNISSNTSYNEEIKLDESAFNSDEKFVYITDIDLHDESLNKIASVKLAQPFAKKNSDNVLFRVKMDF